MKMTEEKIDKLIEGFTEEQKDQIYQGIWSGLDFKRVKLYAKQNFSSEKMEYIRLYISNYDDEDIDAVKKFFKYDLYTLSELIHAINNYGFDISTVNANMKEEKLLDIVEDHMKKVIAVREKLGLI